MAYQVLARKWRPKNFKEMVGQEHVLRALINALDENRLHHAYLFTGTRGVGKTTIARIIAKSLNCETGIGSTPCGQCSTCAEIDEGRFVDLIEVDAASRTKVEDTRELLENVQYAPTRGRYKVYLIDEVHMLSTSSFNALLKTLEEPPPHVKFLLATTDPQKLPATVLSRCLQFNLKRMPLEQIVAHHQYILGQENIVFEEAALKHIARAADGSMRDSLSLLDQAIAFGHGQVRTEDVVAMLGFISRDHIQRILAALAQQDSTALMAAVAQLAEMAPDYSTVLNELISVLHQLALAKHLPDAIDESLMDRETVLALAEGFSAEDIQLYYQIALMGKRDLPLVPEPRNGLEMILLRMMAFKPAAGASAAPPASTPAKAAAVPPTVAQTQQAPAAPAVAESGAAPAAPASAPVESEPAPQSESAAAPASSVAAELEAARAALGVAKGKKPKAVQVEPAKTAARPVPPMENPPSENPAPAPEPQPVARPEAQGTSAVVSEAAVVEQVENAKPSQSGPNWEQVIDKLPLQGLVAQLAQNCEVKQWSEERVELVLSESAAFLDTPSNQQRLEAALSELQGQAVKLAVTVGTTQRETPAQKAVRQTGERQQSAIDAIKNDPNVQALQRMFGASVKFEAIKPIEQTS